MEQEIRTIANQALSALDVNDYRGMIICLQKLWRKREGGLATQNPHIIVLVDESISQIVEKAGDSIEVDQPDAFYEWMKAHVIETARKQCHSRARSIPGEAIAFVKSTGLSELSITTFSPLKTGRKCPPSVLSAILRLLDSYPPELAALMIVRHFPPPLAGTFMFTLRDMKAVRPEYSEKAVDVLARALCWMKDFNTAQRNLLEIPDAETRERVGRKLNSLAETLGWKPAQVLFSKH